MTVMDFLGSIFILAALLLLPGVLLLWVLNLRDVRSLLLSPTIGLGVLAVLTVCSFPFKNWSRSYPAAFIAFMLIVLVAQHYRNPMGRRKAGFDKENWSAIAYPLLGVASFWIVYLPPIIRIWVAPDNPQSLGDAAFHTQGTSLVASSGDVNPFSALATMFDPVMATTVYYPTLWHSLSSLVSDIGGNAAAMNALSILAGLVIWPMSLSALGLALSPGKPSLMFWVPFFASLTPLFPGTILFRYAVDAFALSVSTVPASIAVMLWLSKTRLGAIPARKTWLLLLFLLMVAAAFAQPTTLALVWLALTALVGILIVHRIYRDWSRGDRGRAITISALTLVAILAGILILWKWKYLRVLAGFARPSEPYSDVALDLLKGIETDTYFPWSLIMLLALVGLVVTLRTLETQVVVATLVMYSILYLAAGGPENMLRGLTSIWYKDPARLGVFVLALVAGLAALGTVSTVGFLARFYRVSGRAEWVLGSSLALVTAAGSLIAPGGPFTRVFQDIQHGYDLSEAPINLLDTNKMAIISRIDDFFPAGSYIIGPPSAGTEFVSADSSSLAFIPLNPPQTEAQKQIAGHFKDFASDPQFCNSLSHMGIVGIMTTTRDPSDLETQHYAGFFGVDDDALELLAESDYIRLWRISTCG